MPRFARLALLLVVLPIAAGACKKKPAATPPSPTPAAPATPVARPAGPDADSLRRAEEEAMRRRVEAARATLLQVIYFEYDSDELRPDAVATLDGKLAVMNANPALRIRIEGHCDERGSAEYNLALGRRRAEIAKRYLTDRGIDASRIETMSFGNERPAVPGSSEEAWAQNRRDEFQVIAGGTELRAP